MLYACKTAEGDDVLINLNMVIYMAPDDYGGKPATAVFLENDKYFLLQGSYESHIKGLEKANQIVRG